MLAAIRVRGWVNLSPNAKKTLELLGLDRVNHLCLLKEEKRPMLDKACSFITFGEIDAAALALALEKRARLPGDKKLGKEFLQAHKFKDFLEMAEAIIGGKTSLKELGLKKVFRLGPPKKGYERRGIKKSFAVGGALGYRAGDINALIKRMA